jgi:hypothetical protein
VISHTSHTNASAARHGQARDDDADGRRNSLICDRPTSHDAREIRSIVVVVIRSTHYDRNGRRGRTGKHRSHYDCRAHAGCHAPRFIAFIAIAHDNPAATTDRDCAFFTSHHRSPAAYRGAAFFTSHHRSSAADGGISFIALDDCAAATNRA